MPPQANPSLLELLMHDASAVEAAVAQARSAFEALKLLSYVGTPARKDQLEDAISYFCWSTVHWHQPLAPRAPVRDFANPEELITGSHGPRFEQTFCKLMEKLVAFTPAIFYSEKQLLEQQGPRELSALFGEDFSWDGALVHKRTIWLFEVKASLKTARHAERQLKKRAPKVRELRNSGWAVKLVVVASPQQPSSELLWHRTLRQRGVRVLGLDTLTLTSLGLRAPVSRSVTKYLGQILRRTA